MLRLLLALLLLPAGAAWAPAWADVETAAGQQELVDRSTLAANDILSDRAGQEARDVLRQARAVMICPRVLRAGFLFGGEGGGCVLLARGGQGTWSPPAFYSMGGGSFGLQAGIQDAEVMMLIRSEAGLRAVMDSQFKIGAGASVAFVTVGGGIEGATAAGLNSDIIVFAKTRGLYAGVSLQGSVMSSDSVGDQTYYGTPVGPVDVVLALRVNNPGADPLRATLMRHGDVSPPAYVRPPAYSDAPNYPPQTSPVAPVQSQNLPPP